jgi:hypothetical protein
MTARPQLLAVRRRRLTAGLAALMLASAGVASTAAVASAARTSGPHVQPKLVAPASNIGYAVSKPLCATAVKPGDVRCFALERVPVKKGTPGAYPYLKSNGLKKGPAGGYTPADLAILYGYNPKVSRSGQTVGIVDWFDDPHIASDLKFFDHRYGLHAETARSFRKVNQKGTRSPLPSAPDGRFSSGEISLDVESVRSVCQTCRILLVEAKTPSDKDVSTAENTAVRLGATEVTNSFGAPERIESATSLAAYNHPGVVITASTGDDGWYGWDFGNNPPPKHASDPPNTSENAAEFPATDPDVVSVGGVGFTPGTGAKKQYVWNNNGAADQQALTDGEGPEGAGGGGCSKHLVAKTWQAAYPGYTAAGCNGKRLAADVAELADPATGFDEYNTWVPSNERSGWATVGGTSLASPIVAALYALAGGSGGAAYPSESLYENASLHPTSLTDVTIGGNGFCGGATPFACGTDVESDFGVPHTNPNGLGAGNVDCSFPRNLTNPSISPPLNSECNAVMGFDGPTGVGVPHGVGLFTSTSPRISLTHPTVLRLHASATYTAHATELLAGAHITKYTFSWGDGQKTTGTSVTAAHTYAKAGTHVLTLTVTDSLGQQSVSHTKITLGTPLSIKVFEKTKPTAGHKDSFTTKIVDPNTGGTVESVKWSWGDHKSSKGAKASHTWHKAGTYKLTVTVIDNTGIRTTFNAKITVKS